MSYPQRRNDSQRRVTRQPPIAPLIPWLRLQPTKNDTGQKGIFTCEKTNAILRATCRSFSAVIHWAVTA